LPLLTTLFEGARFSIPDAMLEGSSGVRKLHQEKINNLELIREEIRVV